MGLLNFGILGLFIGSFLSATILPFPSEAILIGIYKAGYPVLPCLFVATVGNLLGGLTNYYIGYKGHSKKLIKKFKLNQEKLDKWEVRLSKWGIFLGLLSWVPFVGDPMVAALGFFRVKLVPLIITMFIGKFLRYFVLTMIYLYVH